MSISQEFREIGNVAGRRLPEKSNFSLTCNLLSQYLKEKNSFGDLSFVANSPRDLGKSPAMDLFPQHTGFTEEVTKKSDISEIKDAIKPKPRQMTIMYAGKVLVFDDISEEKVKELMGLATNVSLVNKAPPLSSNLDLNVKKNIVAVPDNNIQRPMITGLPIARKASLHRFLEKRKDRINARAPYQISNYSTATATKAKETKPEETMTWLGLASPASSGLGM